MNLIIPLFLYLGKTILIAAGLVLRIHSGQGGGRSPAAGDPGGNEITVNSLPAGIKDAHGREITEKNWKEIFWEEVRKASTDGKTLEWLKGIQPGEYFFTIIFRIEKSAAASPADQ